MEHGEQSATPGQPEPAKSTLDVWPPPPVGDQKPPPVAERKSVWLQVLSLVVSALSALVVSTLAAMVLGVVVYCLGEVWRGIPVPLLLLSMGSYALVVVSIVWLCRPRK